LTTYSLCVLLKIHKVFFSSKGREMIMAIVTLDALGLKCPQLFLKIAAAFEDLNAGNILEVLAGSPTFETDVHRWCERGKKNTPLDKI
jgi:TusA-related sulfurtransferase